MDKITIGDKEYEIKTDKQKELVKELTKTNVSIQDTMNKYLEYQGIKKYLVSKLLEEVK